MEIGILAKTFPGPTVEAILDAVIAHGFHTVQFNLSCAGVPTLPDEIDPALAARIRDAHQKRGITICALSGTFNMIDPVRTKRQIGLKRLETLVERCAVLGANAITLCTGTRDPEDMWRFHPANAAPDAWRDLIDALAQVLSVAERHGVTLLIEPEPANVVDSAPKARRLLDDLQSSSLGIVLDGANLIYGQPAAAWPELLDEAFSLLGDEIVIAHAKDVRGEGAEMDWATVGKGRLDYRRYLGLLQQIGFPGPLVMHGLSPSEVDGSLAFLRSVLAHSARDV